MARTNYQRGVEIERKVMEILEEAGYEAMRTAGSHGIFDVCGYGPCGVRFIQVKRAKKGESWKQDYEQAVESIQQLPKHPSVSGEVWVWVDYEGFVKKEVIL